MRMMSWIRGAAWCALAVVMARRVRAWFQHYTSGMDPHGVCGPLTPDGVRLEDPTYINPLWAVYARSDA